MEVAVAVAVVDGDGSSRYGTANAHQLVAKAPMMMRPPTFGSSMPMLRMMNDDDIPGSP